jgi:hypothetical protein
MWRNLCDDIMQKKLESSFLPNILQENEFSLHMYSDWEGVDSHLALYWVYYHLILQSNIISIKIIIMGISSISLGILYFYSFFLSFALKRLYSILSTLLFLCKIP